MKFFVYALAFALCIAGALAVVLLLLWLTSFLPS